MLLLEQLQLSFESPIISCPRDDRAVAGQALRLPGSKMAPGAVALQSHSGRTPSLQQDVDLAQQARKLLRAVGASRIAAQVRVEWNARLKTCAGHADYRKKLISLNPRLRDHGFSEIDRTIRHELAHLVAQSRAGRRRILPHGPEWRAACRDLGIGDEVRCHSLPFPVSTRARRYVYKCPNCFLEFPRVRRIRRATACLACCRAHNHGRFHAKFRLQLVPANGCLARTRT
jgi:predicted SprT family Zn-dependent metalloprotease